MASTPAFQEFERNLEFARRLVAGGRRLEELQVGSFDTSDLYRAAWVQAVSALDHWVHQEIYHRVIDLVQQPSVKKPERLRKWSIPLSLFDDVHHGSVPVDQAFGEYVRQSLAYVSYQQPDKIKEGFSLVTDVPLWSSVTERLNRDAPGSPFTEQVVKDGTFEDREATQPDRARG